MSKRAVLVPAGEDPIEFGARVTSTKNRATGWIGPLVLVFTLAACGITSRIMAAPNPTPIPTAAGLPTATITGTPAPTETPTPTATATGTPAPTETPSPTATTTPSPTATETPLPTNTPLPSFIRGIVVNARQLNIRYGPGTAWPAFTQLNRSDQVRIVGRDSSAGWALLEQPAGGWVNMAYITTAENIAYLPVIAPPPPPD